MEFWLRVYVKHVKAQWVDWKEKNIDVGMPKKEQDSTKNLKAEFVRSLDRKVKNFVVFMCVLMCTNDCWDALKPLTDLLGELKKEYPPCSHRWHTC